MRLNKFLSQSGITSRRKADELIKAGKIRVNGSIVTKLGTLIDPQKDRVFFENKEIKLKPPLVYYLLNKPKGYITTSRDSHSCKNVLELVPKNPRVFCVGRLDKDSTGALILTNDGDLAYKLTHPKFEKEKEYYVNAKCKMQNTDENATRKFSPASSKKNNKQPMANLLKQLERGIALEEGIAKADKIEILRQGKNTIEFKIVIHQGWKRQIRRMCEKVGLKVIELKRTKISNLSLGNLKEGEWRKLSKEEIALINS